MTIRPRMHLLAIFLLMTFMAYSTFAAVLPNGLNLTARRRPKRPAYKPFNHEAYDSFGPPSCYEEKIWPCAHKLIYNACNEYIQAYNKTYAYTDGSPFDLNIHSELAAFVEDNELAIGYFCEINWQPQPPLCTISAEADFKGQIRLIMEEIQQKKGGGSYEFYAPPPGNNWLSYKKNAIYMPPSYKPPKHKKLKPCTSWKDHWWWAEPCIPLKKKKPKPKYQRIPLSQKWVLWLFGLKSDKPPIKWVAWLHHGPGWPRRPNIGTGAHPHPDKDD